MGKGKLNLEMVNCILLVVIFILVIVCVVKQNEGFYQGEMCNTIWDDRMGTFDNYLDKNMTQSVGEKNNLKSAAANCLMSRKDNCNNIQTITEASGKGLERGISNLKLQKCLGDKKLFRHYTKSLRQSRVLSQANKLRMTQS